MAELVFKDPMVEIGSTEAPLDISAYVRSATITYSAELQDKTASGDGTRTRIPGLYDWSITLGLNQDFSTSVVGIDKLLWSLVGTDNTACYIWVRAKTTAPDPVNPQFWGKGLLEGYSPISGSIGDLMTVDVTFQAAGNLTRTSDTR